MKERISSGTGVTGPAKKAQASGKRGFTSEKISFNRKMVAASAAVTARKSTIHSLCETDITLPRRMMREHFERTGGKLSFTAYIVYCLAQVIKEHPHLNAFRRGNRLITLDDVTVSVLVEREISGERVPEPLAVEAAQNLTYREINDLIRSAQERSESSLGSFTGMTWIQHIPGFLLKTFVRLADRNIRMAKRYGKVAVTAVGMFSREPVWFIPHGSATALITVGSIEKRMVFNGESHEEREFLCLTGSFDHAIVDGAPAARFMNQFLETLKSGMGLGNIAVDIYSRSMGPGNIAGAIYSGNSDGSFYPPFSLSIDDMERLMLINFEKDPDRYYNTFELQQALDKTGSKRLLVIAYRNDGGADVYHQPGYPLASQEALLNDVNLTVCLLEGARFEVDDERLDVFFAFQDRYGRAIRVKAVADRKPRKKPFFLLAPIGMLAKLPKSFPVYSLYGMSFAKRRHTDIEILIGETRHKPDTFPLPVDGAGNYFSRYSADTFNVDWNRNFQGQLLPLIPGEDNRAVYGDATYELVNNGGHHEIKRMSATNRKHRLSIDFSPAVPDIECLRDGLETNGDFVITTDGTAGSVRGVYHVRRRGNDVEMSIHPDKGWVPGEKRLILKLLFLVVKVFKEWPKSYRWDAAISFGAAKYPVMQSSWRRI